jgi:hypothetical protein
MGGESVTHFREDFARLPCLSLGVVIFESILPLSTFEHSVSAAVRNAQDNAYNENVIATYPTAAVALQWMIQFDMPANPSHRRIYNKRRK